jgi:hypothetical protein
LEKGEFVNKYSTFIFALIALFGVGLTAHAQEAGTVVATIPFEFIVSGKTMPAGTYTVSRGSSGSELLMSSRDNGVFVIPTSLDTAEIENPLVTFDKVEGAYFLHTVNTPVGTFIVDTHGEERKLAQAKLHDGMTASGSH